MVWVKIRKEGDSRVLRGGSWSRYGWDVRSAFRDHGTPDDRNGPLGFRLSLGHELKQE